MTVEKFSRSSSTSTELCPKLRPIEVGRASNDDDDDLVVVHDPTGLAGVAVSVSMPALFLLTLMDGRHNLDSIQREFHEQFHQSVSMTTLTQLVEQLQSARLLEGPAFESFYQQRLEEYRAQPTRRMSDLAELGFNGEDPTAAMNRLFDWKNVDFANRNIAGIVAPHLDYPRGQPCYLEAYSVLRTCRNFRRFIILGTNHFGRSTSFVTTTRPFETPLGTTSVDTGFIEKLEYRCEGSLRRFELDHQREHSVELQVLLLQLLFGPDQIKIVPFLCPNPCGPPDLELADHPDVDASVFCEQVKDMLKEDATPTCVIAGADLSHVGAYFGDGTPLTDEVLNQTREADERVLMWIARNDPNGLIDELNETSNPTKICSIGCLWALMAILPDAHPELLKYHQAVNHELQCCVSCTAVIFVEEG